MVDGREGESVCVCGGAVCVCVMKRRDRPADALELLKTGQEGLDIGAVVKDRRVDQPHQVTLMVHCEVAVPAQPKKNRGKKTKNGVRVSRRESGIVVG